MITGPTPGAAARTLREVLQRAVSCVTAGVLVSDPRAVTQELRLTSRLARSAAGGHLVLSLEHRYSLVSDTTSETSDRWRAQTVGYLYTLDDVAGREILAYHWHPSGRSPVVLPHIHLGAAAGQIRTELAKAHLSTGLVTPTALLALVVEQFDVRPRRADWSIVLERARRSLEAG